LFREIASKLKEEDEEEKEEIEEEISARLFVPANVWLESNRAFLPEKLRKSWCFTIRDYLEDLLLSGDVFLAEDLVKLLSSYLSRLKRKPREKDRIDLWPLFEELIL
jgi:hypothetical protein